MGRLLMRPSEFPPLCFRRRISLLLIGSLWGRRQSYGRIIYDRPSCFDIAAVGRRGGDDLFCSDFVRGDHCPSIVYLLTCKKDPGWMKWLAGLVWFFETAHTAFALRQLYYLVIVSFGDVDSLARIDWSMAPVAFTEMLIVALVEGYYIYRIWVLSNRSRIFTAFLAVLLLIRVGFTLSTGIYTLTMGTWPRFQTTFAPSFSVLMMNGFSASAGFQRIDGVLRWIMAYTVNTGVISMVGSVAIAITYSTLKNNLIFGGLAILTSKLYANALHGMLNARRLMQKRLMASVEPSRGNRFSTMYASEHVQASQILQKESGRRIPSYMIVSSDREQEFLELSSSNGGIPRRNDSLSVKVEVQRRVEVD
ncbi:unnamed protein product [Somion occarium]|uniref:DUF6534 domain-containing protein n=1 Tax=Somion occarium TaxID=3059160 RepID=A0ABP1D7G3_9APHY